MAASTMAIASFVIGAASSVASGIQAYQQNKAQSAYNAAMAEQYKQSYEQTTKAAAQEYAQQSAAERISQMQKKKETALEIQAKQNEAIQKAGTMMASTNAAGGVLNYLENDYTRQEAQAKQKLRTEYEMSSVASNLALQSYKTKAENRIASMSGYSYVNSGSSGITTSLLTSALGIGTSAVNAYGLYNKWNS